MSVLFKNAFIIDKNFQCISNAYLGVEGTEINYIGTEKPAVKYTEEKDMTGKLLMPGFVNAHQHSPMVLMRGIGSDLPLHKWLQLMFAIEDNMTAEDMAAGTGLSMLEMLACGTTSFSDMYMEPRRVAEVIQSSGMKADLCRVFMSSEDNTDYKAYDRRIDSLDLFKNYNGLFDDRLHIDFCIHAEYTNTELFVRNYAEELKGIKGARMHIHLSETKSETDNCVKKYGKTPAQWFNDCGVFDIPTFAAHCVWLNENDMDILREKNVSIVHNPESNMKLGSGFAPVTKFLAKGINVALGTDGAASNNNQNMVEEMHCASIIHNGYLNDAEVMNPQQVIKMATLNGAVAQGRSDTGVLEVGKKADICAFDLSAPHLWPNINTMALITYSAQASDVCMTMVNGKVLYENGEYRTLDKERIIFEANRCSKRLFNL